MGMFFRGRQRGILISRKQSIQRQTRGSRIRTCMSMYTNTAEINSIQHSPYCYLVIVILTQNFMCPYQPFSNTMETMTGTSVKPYICFWVPNLHSFPTWRWVWQKADLQTKECTTRKLTMLLPWMGYCDSSIIFTPTPSSDTAADLKPGPSYSMITLTASQKSSKAEAGNHRWQWKHWVTLTTTCSVWTL